MSVFSEPAFWICIALGYFIGSTPIGFLAAKLKGVDIRERGSGNIGATNVFRSLSKPIGITVLILDVIKGIFPVMFALGFTSNPITHVAAAMATILGHNFTFWLKFKGGKGIATTAGTMAPLVPIALVVAVSCWIISVLTTRIVSVGSLAAATVIPIVVVIQSLLKSDWNIPVLIYCVLLSGLAIWKHRSNIERLRNGTEARFSKKTKEA